MAVSIDTGTPTQWGGWAGSLASDHKSLLGIMKSGCSSGFRLSFQALTPDLENFKEGEKSPGCQGGYRQFCMACARHGSLWAHGLSSKESRHFCLRLSSLLNTVTAFKPSLGNVSSMIKYSEKCRKTNFYIWPIPPYLHHLHNILEDGTKGGVWTFPFIGLSDGEWFCLWLLAIPGIYIISSTVKCHRATLWSWLSRLHL